MVTTAVVTKTYSNRAIVRDGPFGRRYYTIIYAIEAPLVERIKFGRTLNIDKRFRQLASASPVSLNLLGSVWLPDDAEADVHTYLRPDHSHGEWFCVTERTREIATLIATKSVRRLAEIVQIRNLLE